MKINIALLLMLLCLPSLAFADCKGPQTQSEMNLCASKDLEVATKEINAVYVNLMRKLDKKQQAEVREVQRQWIKFKDMNCKFESTSAEGGTMQPLLVDTCEETLTRARIKDLKSWTELFGQ